MSDLTRSDIFSNALMKICNQLLGNMTDQISDEQFNILKKYVAVFLFFEDLFLPCILHGNPRNSDW